ncbi:PD-(D/E)XK nuclease family protein [Streptomyces albipurpureus]|uniref:PD-(D/E)XK nuclease family protein n=1 Tax=Streptomyces albipurpureus TaxID=2897419 RepID=A0ABT0UTK3_9ACTN|nr:PD-(D/E)XK nuclease family protein [Streptomyces sp. CWNU-1]MCM2391726.1 PD-(D/E)XK nuclease family protein [Streptomyces sp. CWNU-1]
MAGVSTIKRGDSRFYIDPGDAHIKVPGVTTVVDQLPKSFLKFWAVKVTAEAAVKNEDVWLPLARRDPQGAIDYLKRAHLRQSGDAAHVGSMAHDLFERAARGDTINPRHVHADVKQHLRWFLEFLDEVQPKFLHLEETVWSDEHRYAGSFDAIADVDGERVVIDWKTSRDVYASVALQLSAYRYADRIIQASDGEPLTMPELAGGAVLHVRPEGWKLVPVQCDDEVFRKFLALREVFDWETDMQRGVVGRPIARGGSQETGTERRAV